MHGKEARARMHRWCAMLLLCPALSGCGAGYLLQATRGQVEVLAGRRSIERVIADPRTAPELRARLTELQQARDFASRELGLPDNRSYRSYTELERPYVVWSVVATPEFSVEPLTWCFPVVGCVAYRGYFREAAADRFAAGLAAKGNDVTVGGVPAYSTLGRFADPVLSTMLRSTQTDVIGTMFHELAHQVVYVPGDTAFNEAFAVTVEQIGLERWLARQAQPQQMQAWRERQARQREAVGMLEAARADLARIYRSPLPPAELRSAKRERLARLASDLQALQERWGVRAGFNRWLEQGLNNAHLASVATYWQCVPAFERLFAAAGADLPAFYESVRRAAARKRSSLASDVCGPR